MKQFTKDDAERGNRPYVSVNKLKAFTREDEVARAKELLDIIPELYDTERTVRIVG